MTNLLLIDLASSLPDFTLVLLSLPIRMFAFSFTSSNVFQLPCVTNSCLKTTAKAYK